MSLIYFGPRFIAQPHLIPKSPSQIFALPGDEISLSVETERGLRTTWTYEAQIIPEVPEDPEMAFERGLKDNKISETHWTGGTMESMLSKRKKLDVARQ